MINRPPAHGNPDTPRANLVIENMIPSPNDDAFFAMMLDECVPPPLVSQILLRLLDEVIASDVI